MSKKGGKKTGSSTTGSKGANRTDVVLEEGPLANDTAMIDGISEYEAALDVVNV